MTEIVSGGEAESRNGSGRSLFVLLAVFAFFVCLHAAWLVTDNRPVLVETHFFPAAGIAHGMMHTGIAKEYPFVPEFYPYPPLVTSYTAPFLALFGCRLDVAVLTLLPFAWILMYSIWRIGRMFFSETAAVTAAILALCFHHFVNVEPTFPAYPFLSEYLLDLPTSAFAALALLFFFRVSRDDSLWNRFALGIVVGLGSLIRVNYPLYLLVFLAALFLDGGFDRRTRRSLWHAFIVAAVVAGPWYVMNLPDLVNCFLKRELSVDYAVSHGMPAVWSFAGFLYYFPVLVSMMSWPLAIISGAGIAIMAWKRAPLWKFICAGWLLFLLVFSLFYAKNARIILPCMVLAAIPFAWLVDALRVPFMRTAAVSALIIAACFRMICLSGFVDGYRDSTGIQPAPDARDWRIGEVMNDIGKIREPGRVLRVGVVSFSSTFRHIAFQQYALERGIRMVHDSDWRLRSSSWKDELELCEFVVAREGVNDIAQGSGYFSNMMAWVQSQKDGKLHSVRKYQLPDGSVATLYRNDRRHGDWAILPGQTAAGLKADFDGCIGLVDFSVVKSENILTVECEWAVLKTPPKDYKVFIQLRTGYRNFLERAFLPCDQVLPISLWPKGLCVKEKYSVPLPSGFEGKEYDVWLGWYRGWPRLPLRESSLPKLLNAVKIGRVRL